MALGNKEHIEWQKLARYLAAEGSAAEQRRLEAWIQADAGRRVLAGRLRRIWEAAEMMPSGSFSEISVEADWEAMDRKLHARSQQVPGRTPSARRAPTRRRRRSLSFMQFASVALLLFAVAVGALLVAELSSDPSAADTSLREIVTRRGERAKVRLADGTEVILNVDSRLRLPATFGKRSVREVYLRGEAYFDVAPNPERPFLIHAGNGLIRVEGTAFNVEAYPEEQTVEVAVAAGTVFFKAEKREKKQGIRVEAGQLGRLENGGSHAVKIAGRVDVEAYLSWIEGRLVFQNTPLREVAARIERWYDVDCTIEGDEIGALHFTAVLNSRSIRDVLEVLTTSLGLEYRIEGTTVVLWKRE